MRSVSWGLLAAGVLGLWPAWGRAAGPPPPLIATVDASSSKAGSVRALDGVAETSWCPGASDKTGELVLHFPRPVRLKSLAIYAGRMDMRHLTDGWYRPTPVEVRMGDDPAIAVDPRGQGQGPLAVTAAKGKAFEMLTLHLPPAGPRDQRCLAEIDVELEDGAWFFGIPPAAVEALSPAIKEITEALRACDSRRLKQVAGFPVARQELQVGFAGAEKHRAASRTPSYTSVGALSKDCRALVFPPDDDRHRQPRILRSLAPGVVRVEANQGGGATYWLLTWTPRGWRLTGVEFTSFE